MEKRNRGCKLFLRSESQLLCFSWIGVVGKDEETSRQEVSNFLTCPCSQLGCQMRLAQKAL